MIALLALLLILVLLDGSASWRISCGSCVPRLCCFGPSGSLLEELSHRAVVGAVGAVARGRQCASGDGSRVCLQLPTTPTV